MTISEFIEQFVEGYIFEDLETMSQISPTPNKAYGAVGYPMVMTILSSMELLGGLLLPSSQDYNPRGNSTNFINYWEGYLSGEFNEYKGLGNVVYRLVRNGIAHSFIAKHGIVVDKLSFHALTINQAQKELSINPNILFKEFKQSYSNRVKPIFTGEDAGSDITLSILQDRINVLELNYREESISIFSKLQPKPSFDKLREFARSPQLFGATGAMGPVDTPSYNVTTQTTTAFPHRLSELKDDENADQEKT